MQPRPAHGDYEEGTNLHGDYEKMRKALTAVRKRSSKEVCRVAFPQAVSDQLEDLKREDSIKEAVCCQDHDVTFFERE